MAPRTPSNVVAHIKQLHEEQPSLTALEIKTMLNLPQAECTVWRIMNNHNKFHNLSLKTLVVPPGHCIVCGQYITGQHYSGKVMRSFFSYRQGMTIRWLCLHDYCLLFREAIIDREYRLGPRLYNHCPDCERRRPLETAKTGASEDR